VSTEGRTRSASRKAGLSLALAAAMACGGGGGSTGPGTGPTPSPASYNKTLSIVGIPSQRTLATVSVTAPASGRTFDDAFFQGVGVSPAPQYAVCTDAPINGFIGEIAGARRNGVLNCKFKSDGAGIIYVAEDNALVKCGMDDNGMGRPMLEGTRVGGGLQVTMRKIRDGEDLGTYSGLPIVGRDPADSDRYRQHWIGKLNQLLLVQGVSILRLDYSSSDTSAAVKTGFYAFDGTDGLHLQGSWFAVNAHSIGYYPDGAVHSTGLSEGAEMMSSGRNNPACPPGDPLHGGIVTWGAGEFSETGRNIVPWGVLYGLAEKSGI
jgi:hypothetical protein